MNLTDYRDATLRRLVQYAEAHQLEDIDAVARHLHTQHRAIVKHAASATRLSEGTIRKMWAELGLWHKRLGGRGKPVAVILPNGLNLSEYARTQGHPAAGAYYQRIRRYYLKHGHLPVH